MRALILAPLFVRLALGLGALASLLAGSGLLAGRALPPDDWGALAYIEAIDGQRRITLRDRRTLTIQKLPRGDEAADVLTFDHSRDGRYLAYKLDARLSSQSVEPMHIRIVDIADGAVVAALREEDDFLNFRDRPAWSADSRQIIFTSRLLTRVPADDALANIIDGVPTIIGGARTAVRLYDLGTGAVRTLYETDLSICNALLSPDGRALAFQTGCTVSVTDIYLFDLAEGRLRLVARGSDFWGGYGWSGDGRRFAYSLPYAPQAQGVYVADADGANPRRLTATGRFVAWAADAERLTYRDEGTVYEIDLRTDARRTLYHLSSGATEIAFKPAR
jgi:tricorn protease-like protein